MKKDAILNTVMLRGCRYRVSNNRDDFEVAIPVRLTGVVRKEDVEMVAEFSRQRFTISKPCAQAYLDLYDKFMSFKKDVEQLRDLAHELPRKSVMDIYQEMREVQSKCFRLDDIITQFFRDEEDAKRALSTHN